ncbi:Glucan endo-1,3-beta-D-glucosidase [Cellulophaga algicola DSM 14237]|uniref:Glucan endo-1,3-beta-D-glucosidase n=1 Tax=Cellulophaga algicola (strain DSM 14237 / IC166 / ACAM 630) TaxID=688270 RepID=E6XAW9_CELAD|nr:glycoside hydrolase family 16 protein [Cellulophaga algicola]ADV47810.1 Glucan endo-1,3-beta-D-glucosidase [Cellulophaga algicola DSM 14237]
MRNFKIILIGIFGVFFLGCQEDEPDLDIIVAPSNLQVSVELVGADADNPNGDGSGTVNLIATADDAISYQFVYNGNREAIPSGAKTYNFSTTGLNTYTVAVIAVGSAGLSTSYLLDLEVFASYSAPEELLQMLVADGTRTWRIKAESGGHFGLGPVGGNIPAEWYSAAANEKSATGMYDDRYIFNADGTFTHITNSVNDDPSVDTSGTIFGRVNLVDELGAHNEEANGSDIENYPYTDYSNQWSLTAPDGVETLSLGGTAFLGYYTGGNHKYRIFSRTANEMILTTADGNSEFNWWFILTNQEEVEETVNEEFESEFNTLFWSDEFDIAGAPDALSWTYDLGAGGWGNGESQNYTNNLENAIVEDGSLKITAKADGVGGYTSARLKSQGLFDFKYGRVEVRAKLPAAQGTWPAIWLLGSNIEDVNWPACGEIDVMEQTGWDKTITSAALHFPGNSGGDAPTNSIDNETSTTEFHNYVVDWTADEINILVDDEVFFTQANSSDSVFNLDFFLILNVAMGGTLGGDIDPAFTEDTMEIDYVRVYQ